MSRIVILGAGPAACLLAMALARDGLAPLLIGKPRASQAVEGLSQRVVEGLKRFGCRHALSLLGPKWGRVSAWGGEEVEMNGEFVVERVAFDAALLRDVRAAGLTVLEGVVRHVGRQGDGTWRIEWNDCANQLRQTCGELVVECRGHRAPKTALDIHRGAALVSLGRSFEGACAQPRTTFAEPFAHGWAWGAVDGRGRAHIQTVILPQTLSLHRGDPDATHAFCLNHLHRTLRRFGGSLRATGPAHARGILPVLRGGVADPEFLRIGDAAYTCDPLSGHGVFEAVSGAIAAVPVINTLLRRPDDAALARRYLSQRAEAVFRSRIEAARQHYTSETRWQDEPFWRRQAAPVEHFRHGLAQSAAAFAVLPVVEDGVIVERRVVVSADFPRGVRFVDGVDLAALDERLRVHGAGLSGACAPLTGLGLPPESVQRALRWLQARKLAPCAAH